jgi:hypothetical protein
MLFSTSPTPHVPRGKSIPDGLEVNARAAGTEYAWLIPVQEFLIKHDVNRLKQRLRRVWVASWSAIEQGDCRAVARLTCEAMRLQDAISVAEGLSD